MNQDIKDIKPPLDIPSQWMWVWIGLGLLLVLALVIGLVFIFLRKSRAVKQEEITPLSAWDKAYARLENLRLKKIMESSYLKPFYSELSDIIRHYLEERFSIKAPEM